MKEVDFHPELLSTPDRLMLDNILNGLKKELVTSFLTSIGNCKKEIRSHVGLIEKLYQYPDFSEKLQKLLPSDTLCFFVLLDCYLLQIPIPDIMKDAQTKRWTQYMNHRIRSFGEQQLVPQAITQYLIAKAKPDDHLMQIQLDTLKPYLDSKLAIRLKELPQIEMLSKQDIAYKETIKTIDKISSEIKSHVPSPFVIISDNENLLNQNCLVALNIRENKKNIFAIDAYSFSECKRVSFHIKAQSGNSPVMIRNGRVKSFYSLFSPTYTPVIPPTDLLSSYLAKVFLRNKKLMNLNIMISKMMN